MPINYFNTLDSDSISVCNVPCYTINQDSMHRANFISWRLHDMKTLSVLLALCEGNPLVTGGIPSNKRASNVEIWYYLCYKRSVEQTVELPMMSPRRSCVTLVYLQFLFQPVSRHPQSMVLCSTAARTTSSWKPATPRAQNIAPSVSGNGSTSKRSRGCRKKKMVCQLCQWC